MAMCRQPSQPKSDGGRGLVKALNPQLSVSGRRGRVEREHQVVAQFVGQRHERGGSSKPDCTERCERRCHVAFRSSDIRFSMDRHKQPSRLLRCTRIRGSPGVESQPRRLHAEGRTHLQNEIGYVMVRDRDPIKSLQKPLVDRESLYPRLVPSRRSAGDRYKSDAGGHGRTVSRDRDKKLNPHGYATRSTLYRRGFASMEKLWSTDAVSGMALSRTSCGV